MSRDTHRRLLNALPSSPISSETVKDLGESDAVVGTRPIESQFNEVITEFLLYLETTIYGLGYDPETESWSLLEERSYDQENVQDVEAELMEVLYEWRKEHVLAWLVENDLVPAFEI